MLSPDEFSVGHIASARGLTLVLPVDHYDHLSLVTTVHAEPTAILLDDRDQFEAFGCQANTNYKGILIPDVRIELDETCVHDAAGRWAVPGMVVRRDDALFISTRTDRRPGSSQLVALQRGLVACEPSMAIGFTRWQIVIGDRHNKRTLKIIDLESKPN
ncbi:hypothetical protein ACNJX9_09255 [Bradyrhizobium sp. DASA03076]|uniref:hypothetical protein n=1 Tax=Bradyrhizobium sp. BLXBL-03 TaxID=3395916 RepID=UPI003F6F2E02